MSIFEPASILFGPGALLFNAGSNKQVFSSTLKKILAQIRLSVFEKTQKMHTLIPKNYVTEPKARLL